MNAILNHTESLDACTGCGSKRFEPAYPNDVCRCLDCGLLFRNPRPSQKDIIESYNQGHTYELWKTEDEQRQVMWQIRSRLVRSKTRGGKLLDVGTGDGLFLKHAVNVGYEVSGTEASEDGCQRAQAAGFNVKLGDLEGLDFPESYDVVTMWHVLEHVPFPQKTIQIIHRILAPGGYLVIAVPNELNALLKARLSLGKKDPFAPLMAGHEIHLTHFTPTTLKRMLENNGFEVKYFGVDYAQPFRGNLRDFRSAAYELMAKVTGVHPAACMQVIVQKRS